MEEEGIFPDIEQEKIDKAIIRYQLLLKNSTDSVQAKTFQRKINELRAYKSKIQYLFETNNPAQQNPAELIREAKQSYLELILASAEEIIFSTDSEINHVCLYLDFFDHQFLAIFSEQKIKLDFKYSLERDNFHHRYQDLSRHLQDFLEESSRLKQGGYPPDMASEMKKRHNQKMRSILIETNKFFKRLETFTLEILTDLRGAELICLNSNDTINFEFAEERLFLEGLTVREAMRKLYNFVLEVTKFLNIPEISTRE